VYLRDLRASAVCVLRDLPPYPPYLHTLKGLTALISISIVDVDNMPKPDNLQGALELLVMKILRRGPQHGFAISTHIRQTSDDVLRLEAGSLYPALHRMTEAGLLNAEWRTSEAGRRARFYELTSKGRRKLEAGEKKWHAVSAAVSKVLRAT
jgi:PadR family transcriptional regulator PadR